MTFSLTRALLLVLGRETGDGWAQLFLLGLLLPILPVAIAVDSLRWLVRLLAVRRAVSRRYLICPMGHRQGIWGAGFCCGVCSWTWAGNALICPRCRAASHLRCVCGVAIENPLAEDGL